MHAHPIRILLASMLLVLFSCHPVGPQMAWDDVTFSLTQRDSATVRAISTESFQEAVWNRLDREEFRTIAKTMGRGTHGEVVLTNFRETEADIIFKVEGTRQRFRINMVYNGTDWLMNDVEREKAPAQFVSMRLQAEAWLAVRDFRRELSKAAIGQLAAASSRPFADEWNKVNQTLLDQIRNHLAEVAASTEGELEEVLVTDDKRLAAKVQGTEHTFYFVKEHGRLVVNDLSLPDGEKSLRSKLREAVAKGAW